MIAAIVPLKSGGTTLGAAVGTIDPTSSALRDALLPARLGETGYIEVVDSKGIVLASTKPERLLESSDHGEVMAILIASRKSTKGTCHTGCHQENPSLPRETEVMAFAPLSWETVPWGVSIRQSEREALAPAHRLQQRFLFSGVTLTFLALLFAWGMARSIIRPLQALTTAAQRIATGDLSQPIPTLSRDEIGTLATSFDKMRRELKASLEKIQDWNRDLESRIKQRTQELEESYKEIQHKDRERSELLGKVISAQEEERKRIARELHDDTSQALAALVMALDRAASHPNAEAEHLRAQLAESKALAVKTLDSIHQLIFDLRPSVLDDLGLPAALRWYAESRLSNQGIKVRFEETRAEKRLPPQIETALFRIGQEAITNIARHAEAENVVIGMDFRDYSLILEIEDDGKGFDPVNLDSSEARKRGFGLLGMKERVNLLGGKMDIESHPGSGTHIVLEIPLPQEGEQHG